MKPRISLVVPMLNEARTLPELLAALKSQTRQPDEVIFIDAGSVDGSPELVFEWWERDGWPGLGCRVLSVPGALPGAGRNAGVRAAKGELIAFLDAGIEPDYHWLEELERALESFGGAGIFGVCRFSGESVFQTTLCALSNGQGAIHPVVPASIFKKEVFNHIGFFPENLRAAEDLLWVAHYELCYGKRAVCPDAKVNYRHFSENWVGAALKWRTAEYFSVLAGVRVCQQIFFLLLMPMLYAALLSGTACGVMVFVLYLMLRGVVDPVRRSQSWQWWRPYWVAILFAIPIAAILDVAKFMGIIEGWLARWRSHPSSP